MIKKLFVSGLVLSAAITFGASGSEKAPCPVKEYHDYDYLITNHEFNNYPNFDGITCAVIVLNALNSNNQDPTALGDKTVITQENIFNSQVLAITTPETVEAKGVAIEQLTQILKAYGLKAKAQYPHIMTKEALKEIATTTIKDPNTMMIVQFDESKLQSKEHIAYGIVAGYDSVTDSVLLLNVDSHSASKAWVKTEDLLKAMQSLDENHTPRGMILVEKPQE